MKKARGFTSIESLLGMALSSVEQGAVAELAKISRKWEEIVGFPLAGVSVPAELSSKRLIIWVKEPVWADSMMYMKAEIVARINRLLKKDAVNAIRTVYKADFPGAPVKEKKVKEKEPPLPAWAVKQVDDTLDGVKDSELRLALRRVMLKGVALELKRSSRR